MISLYDRLKKNTVVVADIETTGLTCGEEGKESDHIIEIAAVKCVGMHLAERFHTYVACPVPLSAEISELTGITDEMLAGAPQIEEALRAFAAFSEGCILAGYNLAFDCKFFDYYGGQCGVEFSKDRVDILPLARRVLGKRVQNYRFGTVAKYMYIEKEPETAVQCAETAADILGILADMQKSRFNKVPYKRIVTVRRKIRLEVYNADDKIAESLLLCALFGENHPLFPLWVYKCAEELEYISRFVDKKNQKLPRQYYERLFTAYNEAVWETKMRLGSEDIRKFGTYELTDELCERVFAIYDAVRVSCMPYLLDKNETYGPGEYASIIVQAVETEGKNREIRIDYDNLYTKYSIYR